MSSIEKLLQPLGGLFRRIAYFPIEPDEVRIWTAVLDAGNMGQIWPHVGVRSQSNLRSIVVGSGTGLTPQDCLLPAVGEGLERYCASVFNAEQLVWATAEELGAQALDLDTIPRCSELELSHVRCPLIVPDKKLPIRWIRGLSLSDGRLIYLPAVMIYLGAGWLTRAERICVPISTGCAAHSSYERALLSAILEVIERDAISILWLQKLPLPRIEVGTVPASLSHYWEIFQQSCWDSSTSFFDATTDLGIPTVYGLQVFPHRRQAVAVACCASLSPFTAISKVMRDLAAFRVGQRRDRTVPDSLDDFVEVFHGAAYMARYEHHAAFDFLHKSEQRRPASQMISLENGDDVAALCEVLRLLQQKRLDVYAVDLSTDEAIRAGFRAVRVVIPGLQPLGYYYRARYLGHPRLYQAPKAMGHVSHAEADLNHWPQPFD
jgi:ribosomal protein S12 methylthiotransferase accessory factor